MAAACDTSCGFLPNSEPAPQSSRARLTKLPKKSDGQIPSSIPVPSRQHRAASDKEVSRVLRIQALNERGPRVSKTDGRSPTQPLHRTQPIKFDALEQDDSSLEARSILSDAAGVTGSVSSVSRLSVKSREELASTGSTSERLSPRLLRKRQHKYATTKSRGPSRFREDLHDFDAYRDEAPRDDMQRPASAEHKHDDHQALSSKTSNATTPNSLQHPAFTSAPFSTIPLPVASPRSFDRISSPQGESPVHASSLDWVPPQFEVEDDHYTDRYADQGWQHQPLPPLPAIAEQQSRESLFQMPIFSSDRFAHPVPPLPPTLLLKYRYDTNDATLQQNMDTATDITQLASPLGPIDREEEDAALGWDLHESRARDMPPSMAAVSALPILSTLRPSSGSLSGTSRSSRSEKPRVSALQPRSPASEKPSWLTSSPHEISVPPKVAPDVSKPVKMQKRGPVAGTGHEGYGKYKNLPWEKKEPAAEENVYRAPWGYRRKSVQNIYPPDERTKHGMSPVVPRGGGSISGNSDFTDYVPFASSNGSPLTSRTSTTSVGRISPQVPSRMVVAVQNTTHRSRKYSFRASVSSRNEEIGGPPYDTAINTETQPPEPRPAETNETTPSPIHTVVQAPSRPMTPLDIVRAVGLAVSPRAAPYVKTQTRKSANNRIWHIFPKANRRLQRVHKRSIFKRVRLLFTKTSVLPTHVVDQGSGTPVRWGSHRVLPGSHRSFEALRDIGLTDRPSPSQHIVSLQREPVSPTSLRVTTAGLPHELGNKEINESQAHELPALSQSPALSLSEPIHETSSQSRPQSDELDASSNYNDHPAATSPEEEVFPVHAFPKPLQGHVPAMPLPSLAEEEYNEMEELQPNECTPENARYSSRAITLSPDDRAAERESYASSHQSSLFPSGMPHIELETATALSISSSMANLVEDGLVSRSNSHRERELKQVSDQLSRIKSRAAKTVFPNLTQMASIAASEPADAPKSRLVAAISSPLKVELAQTPSPRASRLPRRSANSTPVQASQPASPSVVVDGAVLPAARIDSPLAMDKPISTEKSRQLGQKKGAPQSSEYITYTKADPLAVANLRYGALITSKWLSFGRVLLSPVDFNPERPTSNRVLVLDGLSKGNTTVLLHFCPRMC